MKNPRQISGMLAGFAKRHNITHQLTATDVIASAHEILAQVAGNSPIGQDMRITSYGNGVVAFACKHAAARFDAQGVADAVCKTLETRFPSMTFRAECTVRPEAWNQF